jgi:membrane peptidoglycan carboxypeptidase
MIRVDQVRVWLGTLANRLRPAAASLLERMRLLIAMIAPLIGWLRTLPARVAPPLERMAARARPQLERGRQALSRSKPLLAMARPPLEQTADAAGAPAAPAASAVPTLLPQVQRARATLPRTLSGTLDGVLPAANRAVQAVRHQVEAGRDAHTTPRELRDRRGRRLRSSAYVLGPERIRHGRRRATPGVPRMAGSLLPAGVKIALVVLVAGLGFLGSSNAYINYAADLPDAHTITTQPLDEDTVIYAADGTVLADLHPQDQPQHYYESLDQSGKWLPLATVAVEDANFWTEPGIDVFAMGRAALIDYRSKQAVQGASTITQQLVKIRLIGNAVSIDRKIKEAVLAIQVEHTYAKRQILEQYLNSVEYGNNTKGSMAASQVYFHLATKDLDLAQASMLAGIPQSPLYNNPFNNWDQAKTRQKQVLDAMVRTHKITQEQADEAYAEDLSPPAHMFRPSQQILVPTAKSFVDWIQHELSAKYGPHAVLGGGLHVQTTLNLKLQAEAEKAVVDQVNYGRGRYNESQGAMTSLDPRTGAVLTMVGSAGLDSKGGQYDFSFDTTTPRNPGSSMKVYTYTAAIESGTYAMSTLIPDTPISIKQAGQAPYQPKNYDEKSHGTLQLQQAMGNSLNVPAVKVEMTLGVPRVVDMARRMGAPPLLAHFNSDGSLSGYTSDDQPTSFGPSLTLGGYGETPLQMATGAATLAAQGMYHQPYGIASIVASDGTEIFRADPVKGARQVIDPKVAYIMEQIMSNDDNRAISFGHGTPLTLPTRRVAAKTGTSENWRDGWTLGYTPSLASAFWFGNSDYTPMAPGADGVFTAAPAWHAFMSSALDTLNAPTGEWFAEPPGLGHASVGGEPVWLLPGTTANQPMPPLPPGTTSTSSKCPNPNPNPNQNQNQPQCTNGRQN